jgi:hypothetical protein
MNTEGRIEALELALGLLVREVRLDHPNLRAVVEALRAERRGDPRLRDLPGVLRAPTEVLAQASRLLSRT